MPEAAPFRVPYPRNPLFVGRTALVQEVAQFLAAGGTAVLTGTGGLGKTQTAVELAYTVRAAYPDPKSKDPRRVVVDLTPVGRLTRPVTLAEIRGIAAFKDSPLLRQVRLSVVPLTKEQWNALTPDAG